MTERVTVSSDLSSGKKYGVITLITDFGVYYPGVMKCSLISSLSCLNHRAEVIDVCHEVEPFNIYHGAFLLLNSWKYSKAVHCVVVDPTVGSERRAIAVLCESSAFVGPDNGVLYPAAREAGIEKIIALDSERVFDFLRRCLKRDVKMSTTFHGRDVFAPASALTASGIVEDYGEEVDDIVKLDLFELKIKDRLECRIVFNDRFGNAITNVKEEVARKFRGFWFKDYYFPLVERITDVEKGEPFAIIGSFGTLELCIREGSARELGLRSGKVRLKYIEDGD